MLNRFKNLFDFNVNINNRTASGENIDIENTSIENNLADQSYYKGKTEIYEKWVLALITQGQPSSSPLPTGPHFLLNNNIPCWKKDVDGRLTYISPGYERTFLQGFGKSIEDYLGKTDVEFWGEEIGSIYRKNDLKAFYEHELWIGVVPCDIHPGLTVDFNIIKWKEYTAQGVYFGIAGLAIPARRVKDLLDNSKIS